MDKAPEAVVAPVPPLEIGKAVPESVTARVPLVVIGLPDTDRKLGTVMETELTDPLPVPTATPFT